MKYVLPAAAADRARREEKGRQQPLDHMEQGEEKERSGGGGGGGGTCQREVYTQRGKKEEKKKEKKEANKKEVAAAVAAALTTHWLISRVNRPPSPPQLRCRAFPGSRRPSANGCLLEARIICNFVFPQFWTARMRRKRMSWLMVFSFISFNGHSRQREKIRRAITCISP
jgi:hypothetical protein